MDKLEELYAKRRVFEEYNMPVPEDLANEIQQLEREKLSVAAWEALRELPSRISQPAGSRLILGAEYQDGVLVSVGYSDDMEMSNVFDFIEELQQEETADGVADDGGHDDEDEDYPKEKSTKSKSIGFAVKFGDGTVIKHSTAQRTMIEALRHMGLERASHFMEDTFKGYRLIGKEKRQDTTKHTWQKQVDGWWIYTNMSNLRAIRCIKGVAKMLDIPLKIIMDGDNEETEN